MTGLAWYPLYPGDYARDTQHLSLLEHGAYLLLMNHYYSTGSLDCIIERSSADHQPIDNLRIYRLCSAITDEEKKAVDVILKLFFVFKNGKYVSKKIEEVIKEQTEKHAAKSAQAKAAVEAREAKRREREAELARSSGDHQPIIGGSSNQNQNQNQSLSSKKDKLSLDPFFAEAANKISEHVQAKKQISVTAKQSSEWSKQIRLLEEQDLKERPAARNDIVIAISAIALHSEDKYFPVIESGSSFREKFSKIENFLRRKQEQGNELTSHKPADSQFAIKYTNLTNLNQKTAL